MVAASGRSVAYYYGNQVRTANPQAREQGWGVGLERPLVAESCSLGGWVGQGVHPLGAPATSLSYPSPRAVPTGLMG